MGRQRRVLVIGAEAELAAEVAEAAAAEGLELEVAAGLGEGLRALAAGGRYAMIVLSLSESGADVSLARRLVAKEGQGALLVASRAPSARLAMEVIAAGAVDLLSPPYDAARIRPLLAEVPGGDGGVELRESDDELIGESPALLEVFKGLARLGGTAASVLVTGESGTGKELVAGELHRTSGRRGEFVAVNCAAIPEDLLESELFGHEKGAFTGAVARKVGRFERAQHGTIFLDEIGDMSLVLQAKILRVLQERVLERVGGESRIEVDVRVVAATHRDLPRLIAAGEFREDLYYRLAVVRLHLPPLRARGADVEALALHFAASFARQYGRPVRRISDRALALLRDHSWPGNVRELRNAIERAVLLCKGEILLPDHLALGPAEITGTEPPAESLPGYSPGLSLAQVEALHLRQVLRAVDGHFGRAAEVLGLHRNTVSRKAQEHGLLERE
jgi:DNA-binding NtrC family response regulator